AAIVRVACAPSLALSLAFVARLTGGRPSQTDPLAWRHHPADALPRRLLFVVIRSQISPPPSADSATTSALGCRSRLLRPGNAQSATSLNDDRANRLPGAPKEEGPGEVASNCLFS